MANIKDLKRMCEAHKFCTDCPLKTDTWCIPCALPDNADEIVDKWVQEHPVKTYAMDFFSKFPDARRKVLTGIPVPCIRVIYPEFYNQDCSGKCPECWNQEMKEDD